MSLFPPPGSGVQTIKDLKIGQRVSGYYRVLEVKKKKYDGGDFLILQLMDKTGRITAKVWEDVEEVLRLIQPGAIVHVSGDVDDYRGKKEIRIRQLRPRSASDKPIDERDFQETPSFDTDALWQEMLDLLRSHLTTPPLRQLVEQFALTYGETFKIHYGAQKIHHAYPGGLLEHTVTLLKLALLVAPLYGLDPELLALGALFHDLGKLFEFKTQPAPETTREGGLLGHVLISQNLFLQLKDKIPDFPADWTLKIQHLIIAHHGEKEFGSPEVPKTPEAYTLHLLDLLDSRLAIFRETRNSSEGPQLFSDFLSSLGTRILVDKK